MGGGGASGSKKLDEDDSSPPLKILFSVADVAVHSFMHLVLPFPRAQNCLLPVLEHSIRFDKLTDNDKEEKHKSGKMRK